MTPSACPLCGAVSSTTIMAASVQPVMLNVLFPDRADALTAPRTRIDFRGCHDCGFVFNAAFDPRRACYGPRYVNDQSHSDTFRRHLGHVAGHLGERMGEGRGLARRGRIVEVGCGQGGFLHRLCRTTGRRGIGFDPAAAEGASSNGPADIRRTPFTEAEARRLGRAPESTGLLLCRHLLEHIADPVTFLRWLRLAAGTGRLYIEVPSLAWILDHRAFFDLHAEHCSLFAPTTLRHALHRAGLRPDAIEPVFDGQFLAADATASIGATHGPEVAHAPVPDFRAIRAEMQAEADRWAARIAVARTQGPVVIWGASAKGVSLAAHLRLRADDIVCFVDINPQKQGGFVPVTGHEVIAPEALAARLHPLSGAATILVPNPSYAREIAARVRGLGLDASLIDAAERRHLAIHH